MKKLVKFTAVAAVLLTLATAGTANARAGGWPIAAGIAGGFAAGALVSRAVGPYPAPGYYACPPVVYAAAYGGPAPVVVAPPVAYYAPRRVIYPYVYGPTRLGFYPARPRFFRR
jgi:hypothetical protein